MPVEIAALVTLALAAIADAADQPHALTTGLSDQDLWRLVVSGRNPLQGMSFDTAVREDPRRIDALIRQAYYRAMHRSLPSDPMSAQMDEGLYLMGMQAVRRAGGGDVVTLPLISVHEENWYTLLSGTARTWPPFVRQVLARDWPSISASFEEGRQIAHRAELSASGQGLLDDAREWGAFQDTLSEMEIGLHEVLTTGTLRTLPADVRARLQARQLLPGPVRRR